jgi:putative Holliday junction resolvase
VRVIGLDVGSVRIGVAVSDETGIIARGLETLTRKSLKTDLDHLLQLISVNEVEEIVVGNPLDLDGSAGRQAELVREFVVQLKRSTDVPVTLWDERFSSTAAERVLIEGGLQRRKRKSVIDKLAAVIILQSFLDHRNRVDTEGIAYDSGSESGD